MKLLLKKFYNIFLSLLQKRPKRVLAIDIQTAKLLESLPQTEIYSEEINSGEVILNPHCFDEDKIPHFQPFLSVLNYTLIDTTNSDFQFNRNFFIDPLYRVIYQEGISLTDLSVCYQLLNKTKYVRGTVAYLSNSNVNNYGHWFQYTLPLLFFYWKHHEKEKIDYYYLGDIEIRRFQIESLACLGIKREQLINYACKADRMLGCIKNNPIQFNYAKYNDAIVFSFLKKTGTLFGNLIDSNSPKKIYVRRGIVTHRKVIKEEVLIDYLITKGYAIVTMDNLSLKQQAILFHNASEIIAPHGSALTNIMFCNPHTKLLEVFPYNYPDWFNVSFAAHAKLDYYYIVGEIVNSKNNPGIYNDIYVKESKFIRFYENIFSIS